MASSLAVQSVGSAASFAAASAKASVASKAAAPTPVRAFSGLKQQNALSTSTSRFTSVSNGSRIQAMKVWTPVNNKKFETLSYLPPLSGQQILKQVDYLLQQGWSPCIEFDADGFIHREHHTSPGYYDGRYWTMWKLPMFGCMDSNEVLREVEECKRTYPGTYVRVLGFNKRKQVQAAGFIVYKPDQGQDQGYGGNQGGYGGNQGYGGGYGGGYGQEARRSQDSWGRSQESNRRNW